MLSQDIESCAASIDVLAGQVSEEQRAFLRMLQENLRAHAAQARHLEQELQGLLDDGRARAVEVSAEQPHDGRCLLHVTVTDATGQRYSYEHFVPVGA